MPVATPRTIERLEDIPNVGPSIAAKLRFLDLARPQDLVGIDPYEIYDEVNLRTGVRHDPCLLDVFIAAVRFMEGGPSQPWWEFTAERKITLSSNQ